MNMEHHSNLKEQLQALHQSLSQVETIDEETETLLRTILSDIEEIEQRASLATAAQAEDWEATLLRIENQYPNFSHAVRAIIDTLGKMGI